LAANVPRALVRLETLRPPRGLDIVGVLLRERVTFWAPVLTDARFFFRGT